MWPDRKELLRDYFIIIPGLPHVDFHIFYLYINIRVRRSRAEVKEPKEEKIKQ